MIKKMKYLTNLDNSKNKEKDSKKRINYISNRIKRLENDINKIRNKGIDNSSLLSQSKKDIYDNYITTIGEYKSKKPNENKINVRNNLLNNSVNINNNFDKFKTNKLKIFKKLNNSNNNYNSIIHEKKKFFLKNNNSLMKKVQSNNKDNTIKKIKTKNKSSNKIRNFYSFNDSYINHTEKRKNKEKRIINCNFEKLDYKFEMRNLQEKYNLLLKEHNDIEIKLNEIKKINKDLENSIYNNDNEKYLLNQIIMLSRQYMLYNNRNESEIEYEINNNDINNNDLNDNYNNSFENIILNVTDMKLNYDNILLKDEFLDGVNKYFNVSSLTSNNSFDYDHYNIIENINKIIDKKNNLNNAINKYKYLSKESNKYKNYFTFLINDLNLNNLSELDEYIKNAYINNIKENNHMKKLKLTLMNESSSKNKKGEKRIYFSTNKRINNFNHSMDISNISSNNNNKSYYSNKIVVNKKAEQNNINPIRINKIKIMKRNDYNDSNDYFLNKNKNGLLYSENNQNFNKSKRKKRKININFYERNNNYGIKNIFSNNKGKNSFFNTEEYIEDNKYFNNIGRKKIGKHLISNDFDRNYYGHIKNNSVIIFNK